MSQSTYQALLKPVHVYRLQWRSSSSIHQTIIKHGSSIHWAGLTSACRSSSMNACNIKHVWKLKRLSSCFLKHSWSIHQTHILHTSSTQSVVLDERAMLLQCMHLNWLDECSNSACRAS